jgi:E3 ubiquitin-protein ligase UHRF1
MNYRKIFGNIPGIPVGTAWRTRPQCRMDGVHAMLEHGIHGTAADGAYSVVLSAGYKDDKDSGLTL